MICDTCARLEYDEQMQEYYCNANIDEDDMYRMMQGSQRDCPFYLLNDDYALAKKQ